MAVTAGPSRADVADALLQIASGLALSHAKVIVLDNARIWRFIVSWRTRTQRCGLSIAMVENPTLQRAQYDIDRAHRQLAEHKRGA